MTAVSPSKYMVNAGWGDVAHLDEKTRADLERETPPHLRKARMEGIPSLGSGAIYPVEEEVFKIAPFSLPAYWPRSYGMDVGWNKTAAVWQAHDREEDVVYLYAEHYRGQAEPSIHAEAIKARGAWIPGVIDPASNGSSQINGERLIVQYQALGLILTKAENSVDAGILEVWQRLSTGRLKVFSTMNNWFAEYRLYRRDENGKIVKKFDHLMDATRYGIISGLKRGVIRPAQRISSEHSSGMVADQLGGY